jgi:hypothetical protein
MVPVALFLVQTGPFALYTISLNFWTMVIWTRKARFEPWSFRPEKPSLDHGQLDQKSQVLTMVIQTRKAKFGPWSIGPEKPGLDHGHSDQESHIWTMVNRTLKARFGPWSFGPKKTGLDHGNLVLHVFFQSMRTKDNSKKNIIQE